MKLNPGSEEAIKAGCRCPVMDNAGGKGIGGDGAKFGWWKDEHCPIHGWTDDEVAEAAKQANREALQDAPQP